jgi:hypothetical protein
MSRDKFPEDKPTSVVTKHSYEPHEDVSVNDGRCMQWSHKIKLCNDKVATLACVSTLYDVHTVMELPTCAFLRPHSHH